MGTAIQGAGYVPPPSEWWNTLQPAQDPTQSKFDQRGWSKRDAWRNKLLMINVQCVWQLSENWVQVINL